MPLIEPLLLLLFFLLINDGESHAQEAQERDSWAHHNAARAEHLGIKVVDFVATTKHQ